MKPINKSTIQLTAGLLLATLAFSVLPACQKAKMTSIPRHADAPDKPAATPAQTPTVTEPTPTNVTPTPTTRNPRPVDNDDDYEEEDDLDRPNNNPVLIVYPGRRTRPARPQPPVEYANNGKIVFFDSGKRPWNVLPVCHLDDCEELQADVVTHEGQSTNKIDVLFVVDTSASLRTEMPKIAQNITSFVAALPPHTDFRFAMLIGHGPGAVINGTSDWFGRLYLHDATLDRPVINAGVMKPVGERLTEAALVEWLEAKFLGGPNSEHIPTDRTTVQGEALLANLNQFLTRGVDANSNFPRVGRAALAIIFVADENDVCYDYNKGFNGKYYEPRFKGDSSKPRNGGIELDGVLRDAPEHKAFISDVCKVNGQRVDAQLLSQSINALYPQSQRMPVMVSGILYPNNEMLEDGGTYTKDNEMGLGYLDLIQEFNGEVASLAGNDYGQDLAQLGSFSGFRMSGGNNVVRLTSNGQPIDVNGIENLRVEVHISGEVHVLENDSYRKSFSNGVPVIVIDREVLEELGIAKGDQIKIFYTLK